MTDATANRSASPGVVAQWLGLGVFVGVVAGVLFAALDLLGHRAVLSPAEASQIVLTCAAAAVVVASPLLLLAGLLLRLLPPRLSAPAAGALAMGTAAQFAIIIALEGRALLLAAPLPWLLAWAVWRLLRSGRPKRLGQRGLAIALAAALVVPALIWLRPGGGTFWNVSLAALLIATGWAAHHAAARYSWRIVVPLLMLVGLVQTGSSLPGWRITSTAPPDAPAPPVADSLPNVILIVMDTTRRDHLGCYGHAGGLTPNLDALAAEGVVYEDPVSQAPWTVPSHASLFTGFFPRTHGCHYGEHRWLDDSFSTLAEMLQSVGYQTAALVANDYLGQTNQLQGFDFRYELWTKLRQTELHEWLSLAGLPEKWADHGADEALDVTQDWLESKARPDRPFFLFVNLMESHRPYFPPFEWRMDELPPGVGYLEASRESNRYYGANWHAGWEYSDRQAQIVQHLYRAAVAYQDQKIRELLDVLGTRVDLDSTVLIITSDHGENLGDGHRWGHAFAVNDAVIAVPLIVRYPAAFPAGMRLVGQCGLIDVVPTIFDLLGRPAPVADLPGRTLVPGRFQPRELTFSQNYPYYGHFERLAAITGFQRDTGEFLEEQRSVRDGRYKYIWSSLGNHRLHDLGEDPQEELNLVAGRPEIAARLSQALQTWWKSTPPYVPQVAASGKGLSDEDVERLRSLGYVGGQ